MNDSLQLIYMPFYVGDYLSDTMHLTTEQHGAYLLLLLHQWKKGHFLEEEISSIAKLAAPFFGSASSSAQAELEQHASSVLAAIKKMLRQDDNGLWYSPRCDLEKFKYAEKKRVFVERARKGGEAKAKRAREKKAKMEQNEASSSISQANLQGSLKSAMSESEIKAKSGSLRSPFGAAAPAPGGGSPSTPGQVENPEATGNGSRASNPSPAQSARKAKTTGRHPRGVGSAPARGNPVHMGRNGRKAAKKFVAPRSHAKVRPSEVDAGSDRRFSGFMKEVSAFWRDVNKGVRGVGECPWTGPDLAALRDLLRAHPEMKLEDLRAMLRNRAASDVTTTDPPRNWLREIIKFAAEPLDRFKQPKRGGRTL